MMYGQKNIKLHTLWLRYSDTWRGAFW